MVRIEAVVAKLRDLDNRSDAARELHLWPETQVFNSATISAAMRRASST
jgi:hypothetical protein